MQLRNVVLLSALAAAGLAVMGCPSSNEVGTKCSADGDCLESEICHPTAKVCVQTCSSAADCPDTAKTCDVIAGAGGSADGGTSGQKICQCATDALCNKDAKEGTALVCSTLDKVCTLKCIVDSDCGTGRTCDTGTGQCKGGSSGGATCSGTGQMTCSYGQFCSSSTCTAVPAPTCANFGTAHPPTWSATTKNGPVIYEVSKVTVEGNSTTPYQYCQASAPIGFVFRLRAYRTDADWPATRSGLSGLFYVKVNGSELNVVDSGLLVPNTGYNRNSSNLKDAEFQIYLCQESTATAVTAGFYFTNGNEICGTVSK